MAVSNRLLFKLMGISPPFYRSRGKWRPLFAYFGKITLYQNNLIEMYRLIFIVRCPPFSSRLDIADSVARG